MSIITINNKKITANGHKIWINPYGPELISNPYFVNTSGWANPYPDTWVITGGHLVLTNAPEGSYIYTSSNIVDNKIYKMEVEITDYVSGPFYVYIGNGVGNILVFTSNGKQSIIFTKQYSDTYLYPQCGGTTTLNVKSISVKEVLKY